MSSQALFLTLEQILTIHTDQIERYGGSHGLRDLGLLESAVYRPGSTFAGEDLYSSIFDKAAALVHSLLLNHPFVDGNKRTAVASMILFLEMNDQNFISAEKEIIEFALCVENKKPSVGKIAQWIKKYSARLKF